MHKSIIEGLPPNIGHAEVLHKPDAISGEWIDKRFGKKKIDNRERALLASEQIFNIIKKGRVQWNDVKSVFEDIMNAKNFDERIKKVKGMYSGMVDYDEDKWINEALDFQRDKSEILEFDPLKGFPPIPRPRFVEVSVKDVNANWFKFQNAAKKQLAMVMNIVEAL